MPLSTLYTPAEIAKVVRLSDVGMLVSPRRVLDVDVAQRFEAALPELREQSDDSFALRAAPYLRSIVIVGDASPGWATGWNESDAGVPEDVLAAAETEVSWCTPTAPW